jgi:polar amino acid transport system substrate-binding protein
MKSMRSWSAIAVAVLGAVLIAACGSSSKSSNSPATPSGTTSTPAVSASPAVQKLVPASIKSKGTIAVAADATYAPNEFIGPDGKTVIGMDVDLVNALAQTMGLKAQVTNQTFDSILPGLKAGKFDMGASSFTDTKARQKVVNFVDYFLAGTSFYTKASGGTTVTGLSDLCGKTVAVEKGTTEETDDTAQSAKCKKAGKPAVTVQSYPDQNGANLALSSGRAQLVSADSPVAAYAVKKSGGQFKITGQQYGTSPYGFAFPKTSQLDKAALAAMKVMVQNGTYSAILAKWGQKAGAIPPSGVKINGGTS